MTKVKMFHISKEQKILNMKEEMSKTVVATVNGKFNLLDLCETIGIKDRITYFNFIERKVENKSRTMNNDYEVIKFIHDRGFIFKNGLEIRKVDKNIFNLYPSIDIIERRERK
jgi:hypothetical protein